MISSGIIVISGIVIVLAVTVFFGFIFYSMYNNLTIKHWLPQTIIVGITITSLAVCAGIIDNNNSKMEKSIENTIASNYDNVLDYHNYKDNKTFVSGDSRYTFYYDKRTKTLIILKGSNIDAVFVDGVKQNDQKTSDKTDKKKDCISYKTDDADKTDTDKTDSNSDTTSNSSSTVPATAVSLQQKIQDKFQSRYNDAAMTGFDTIKMSGTFSCDNVQYNFQWKDDMLEVINADDADDVTYYKIAQ